jgi:hypothetical protein
VVVTCYKYYGTPHPTPLESLLHALGSRRHWKIPPATKQGPPNEGLDSEAFAALARYRFFLPVFWHPTDFPTANSQMRMALFYWWLPKNAAGWALEAQECCSPGSETSIISQRPLRGTSGPGGKQCHDTSTRSHGTENGPFSGCFYPTCNYFAALSIS